MDELDVLDAEIRKLELEIKNSKHNQQQIPDKHESIKKTLTPFKFLTNLQLLVFQTCFTLASFQPRFTFNIEEIEVNLCTYFLWICVFYG